MSPEISKDAIISVIIVLIVIIVGYLAYTRGVFNGQNQKQDSGAVQINLGGNNPQSQPAQ